MSVTTVDNIEQQVAAGRELIRDIELPPEVESVDLREGTDHVGEPAVWVRVHVRKEVVASREQIQRLTQFTRDLQDSLISGGLTVFPFTALEQAE